MKRYAVWCSKQNINLLKDGRSFANLSYAKSKCLEAGDHLDKDTLYIKEVEVPTIKELKVRLEKKGDLLEEATKVIKDYALLAEGRYVGYLTFHSDIANRALYFLEKLEEQKEER